MTLPSEEEIYTFAPPQQLSRDNGALIRSKRDADEGWKCAGEQSQRADRAENIAHLLGAALAEAIQEIPAAHHDCHCSAVLNAYSAWKSGGCGAI